MQKLVTLLLIVSAVNLLWFPVTDGVHEVLHSLKSSLHSHGHHHHHGNKNDRHSPHHHVEEHDTVKNLLNAFASLDDQKQSITVILFLFFSGEVIYFFLSAFTGKLLLIPDNRQYTLYRTSLTPPPLA